MQTVKTPDVSHLDGSQVGYRLGAECNSALPTLVMVNSFATSSEFYRAQYADGVLMGKSICSP